MNPLTNIINPQKIFTIRSTDEELYEAFKDACYSITFTLKPELYRNRARNQYIRTCPKVREILHMFTNQYILAPELTKQGNIHYHALVAFNSTMEYALEKLIDLMKYHKTLTLYINNHVINNKDSWLRAYKYIVSEANKTSQIIKYTVDEIVVYKERIKHKKKISSSVIDFEDVSKIQESENVQTEIWKEDGKTIIC